MLKALNCHFVSVGLSIAKQVETKPADDGLKCITPVRDQIEFKATDVRHILNAVSLFEKGKASDPDKISVAFVKDAARSISYPLVLICNSSLKQGVFPNNWKVANVTLV